MKPLNPKPHNPRFLTDETPKMAGELKKLWINAQSPLYHLAVILLGVVRAWAFGFRALGRV